MAFLGEWNYRLLASLLVVEWLYLWAVGPVRRRHRWADSLPWGAVVRFSLGLALLFLALGSPLHTLGERHLFSAHTGQHMLLVMGVAPLLVSGVPPWLLRQALRPLWSVLVGRALTSAPAAFLLFNGGLVAWHLPPVYNIALQTAWAHALQHLFFLVAGCLVWWPVLGPLPEWPRLGQPAQLLYLGAMSIPSGVLGGVLLFSGAPVYGYYAGGTLGLDPLLDQELGGILLKVPWAMGFLVALGVVFFSWFRGEGSPAGRVE